MTIINYQYYLCIVGKITTITSIMIIILYSSIINIVSPLSSHGKSCESPKPSDWVRFGTSTWRLLRSSACLSPTSCYLGLFTNSKGEFKKELEFDFTEYFTNNRELNATIGWLQHVTNSKGDWYRGYELFCYDKTVFLQTVELIEPSVKHWGNHRKNGAYHLSKC